jgi:BirA family biotin operon repressor/biotin-[acetyl-CoA-carboxylase] ligase
LSPATPIITLGEPLIELSSIDSTNIYAISQVHQQLAVSGSCYRAEFQTQGKGQHGRVWDSEPGLNLLCSYVLELKSLDPSKNWGPNDQKGLSAAVAIGAKAFFQAHAGDETLIKLPNDIYWRDRKAGGILIENTLRGQEWTWTVIGIGFNINQTQFNVEASKPVSLLQITGKQWEIARLQTELSKALSISIQNWLKEGDAKTIEKMKPLWKSN